MNPYKHRNNKIKYSTLLENMLLGSDFSVDMLDTMFTQNIITEKTHKRIINFFKEMEERNDS